jgi:hypothetical protein
MRSRGQKKKRKKLSENVSCISKKKSPSQKKLHGTRSDTTNGISVATGNRSIHTRPRDIRRALHVDQVWFGFFLTVQVSAALRTNVGVWKGSR